MSNVLIMHVDETLEQLIHYVFCFAFTKATAAISVVAQIGEEVPACTKLEEDVAEGSVNKSIQSLGS